MKLLTKTVAAVAVATLVLGTVSVAGAHTRTFGSSVSIRGKFFGKVSSGRAACERRRRVTLFKVRRGPDRVVGRDTTNSAGRWRISRPNARGRFYARVSPKTLFRNYRHNHRCAADQSRVVRRR